jgi:hypothetical protein
MAESPTQPILVRDDTVVATAVGVSDPSLTLVEFVDGIGFFLAESFQHDNAAGMDFLESVFLRKYSDDRWVASEHEQIVLGWSLGGGGEVERQTRKMKVAPAPWRPAVFFLTAEDYLRHCDSLRNRIPEQVLKAAFDCATKAGALSAELSRLRARHKKAFGRLFASMPKGGVLSTELAGPRSRCRKDSMQEDGMQPVKQTIRISLPPKPGAKETVRMELPPKPADLSSEEKAALLQWLKRLKFPTDPPPQ